jgi:hypothetical protein
MKANFYVSLVLLIFLTCEISRGSGSLIDFRPGYIVTSSYDTVNGLIDVNASLVDRCVFKLTPESGPTVYSPEEIREFRVHAAKYFVSNKITINEEEKQVFLEYLLHGIVNLYFINLDNQDYYFVEKDGIIHALSNERKTVTRTDIQAVNQNDQTLKTYQVRSAPYHGMLTWLFQDAPEVLPLVQNTQYNHRSLIKLTSEYHNLVCDDFDCIDFTSSTRMDVYISAGMGMANSWFAIESIDHFLHDISTMVSFRVRLAYVQFPSGLSLVTGMDYLSKRSFEENFTGPTSLRRRYYSNNLEVALGYNMLKIPIGVQYIKPGGKLQPIFYGGYTNIISFNRHYSARLRFDPSYDHGSVYYRSLPVEFHSYQPGLYAGLGINYRLDNRRSLYLKTDYEFMHQMRTGYLVNDIGFVEAGMGNRTNSHMLVFGYDVKL